MSGWYLLIDSLPFEWAHFSFMQNALLAILLVSPLFALIGTLVISNQMAFFSEAIGHATLTGIAIGAVLGLSDPTWALMGFCILLALVVTLLRRYSKVSADTLIGLVMAFAVALGVVILSRGGGFAKYAGFLIGDLLTITPAEILRLALILLLVGVLWIVYFNRFVLTFLNRSLAQSRGVNIWAMEAFFASIVALVVAVSIPWVGLLVVNSLLIIPAATSRNLALNSRQYLLIAAGFSVVAGISGLVLSFYWGTATGATVVLVALVLYAFSFVLRRFAG
jgi:zinc transport system permease protein